MFGNRRGAVTPSDETLSFTYLFLVGGVVFATIATQSIWALIIGVPIAILVQRTLIGGFGPDVD